MLSLNSYSAPVTCIDRRSVRSCDLMIVSVEEVEAGGRYEGSGNAPPCSYCGLEGHSVVTDPPPTLFIDNILRSNLSLITNPDALKCDAFCRIGVCKNKDLMWGKSVLYRKQPACLLSVQTDYIPC